MSSSEASEASEASEEPVPWRREPGQEVRRKGRWTCRLHIWHRWRTYRYPDSTDYGARYQECLDCGKQRDLPIGLGAVG